MVAPVLDLRPGDDLALGTGVIWTDFTISGVDPETSLNLAQLEITQTGPSGDATFIRTDDHITTGPVVANGSQRVYYDGVAVALLSHPDSTTTRLYFTADATIPIVDAIANALSLVPDSSALDRPRSYAASFKLRGATAQDTGRTSYVTGSSLGETFSSGTVIAGRGGDDKITLDNGTHYIDGGDGTDTVTLGYGYTSYVLDLGNEDPQFLNSSLGEVTLKGIENYTDFSSYYGATVKGTDGANAIALYRGTIEAGGGNDVLSIAFAGTLDGGEGNDTASFAGIYNYRRGVSIDLRNSVQLGALTFESIENVIGTDGSDTLVGDNGDNVLDGAVGNDFLTGNDGNDTLIGGRGADTLDGGEGDDYLRDGGGNDMLIGGIGTDTVDYTDTNGAVIVSLSVTTQQDTNAGGLDTLSSIENLVGGVGNDRFTGTTGANDLRGGNGSDTLIGLGGADTLFGDAGNDTLLGGNGSDRLTGGLGHDVLTGGGDADVFVFTQRADSVIGGQRDVITDFEQGIDKIDVTGISAEANVNQVFIGTADFAHQAGQIRYYQAAGQTIIAGDLTGDGVADYQIQLKGLYAVQATDFV